jgi:hypothetical protein
MRRILLLVASILLVADPALAVAGPASADTADVTCPSGFLGVLNVGRDLIVPAGSSCGLTEGSAIGRDVIVGPGAAFYLGGTTIGRDLIANQADLIELGDVNNGSSVTIVGRDAVITGQSEMFRSVSSSARHVSATTWPSRIPPPRPRDGTSALQNPPTAGATPDTVRCSLTPSDMMASSRTMPGQRIASLPALPASRHCCERTDRSGGHVAVSPAGQNP